MNKTMNLNNSLNRLYSISDSVYQYRQTLTIIPDTMYLYHKEIYTDSLYIEIPDIKEISIISDIRVKGPAKYDIIADKFIISNKSCIVVARYKKVYIRVFDIDNYDSFNISFDVTLFKKSIRSSL